MNIREGANRMQRAGRAMVIIALSAFALCAIGAGIYAFLPSYLHVTEVFGIVLPILLSVIWVCAMAVGLGMVLWVAGWILDGFHNAR
ncbi:MAG TPA: hypothetical protein VKB38_03675 [Terracidiphilus sp.]|nr:hypothetical protein [Terracidiphilus sp.]